MSKEIICSLNERLSLKRCFERTLQTSLRTTIRTSSQYKLRRNKPWTTAYSIAIRGRLMSKCIIRCIKEL